VQIYLTGSSAKLLSKEIATSLRGRSIAIEVLPYSFTEFLRAKQISFAPTDFASKKNALFNDYIHEGGFPEITNLHLQDRIRILQDYVNVVVFRDVIERHKITNTVLVKYIIKTLLKNSGNLFSINKFFNDLKTQGINVSKNTVHEYLDYIEDAYLSFTVPLYSESLRKVQTNPKKVYAIDTGLVNAYTTSFAQNLGHWFENIIYLDLRRQNQEIYYYLTKNRYEVDFLTKDIYGKMHLYQVVWDDNNPQTMEREMRALQAAEQELGIKGELITLGNYKL
jgi:predicted AAA+ superfamily ATPase